MKAFAVLIAMTMAAPAFAADTKPADSQASAETPKKPRQICKREATSTGLHGSRKVCLTAAQWKERNGNTDTMTDTRSKQTSY